MKKFIVAIVAIMLVALTCVSFVGCDNDVDITIDESFGSTMPDQTPAVAVNADMSPIEMLMAAEQNYSAADFVASTSMGSISTKVLKVIEIVQFVRSEKIRNGSVSDGVYTQFSNNLSGTVGYDMIKIWEETYIKNTADSSDIAFRNVDKKNIEVNQDDYTLSIKEGKDFNETERFTDMQTYSDAKAADPSKIWMYDVNEDTYLADQSSEKATYDPETKTYSFTIVANPETSTTAYQEQMMYMLEKQSGMTPKNFRFETIKLEVVMWENGYIKSLALTESYYMQVAGIISTSITLNSNASYSYYPTEEGYTLEDLASKAF